MIGSLWRSIREPRAQRIGYAIGYVLISVGGVYALINPPMSIEGELGTHLTAVWASFLGVGGIAGALSLWPGTWWLEKIGLTLVSGGALSYVGVVITLHAQNPGNRLTQACVVAGLAVPFVIRAWEIRGLDYEPRG